MATAAGPSPKQHRSAPAEPYVRTTTPFPPTANTGSRGPAESIRSRLLALFRRVTNGGYDPADHGFALPTIVIGDQTLHAVGYAIQRDAGLDSPPGSGVISFFGDGASSQGDVNEAFVWAAVNNAPSFSSVRTISGPSPQPLSRQTRILLYRRAEGFRFPGLRVDGNDVLAVLAITRAALDRARRGDGPSLIEAYTYRMGAHTTSDDPTRYRVETELEQWRLKDPIERVRAYLLRTGAGDRAFMDEVDQQADDMAARLRQACRDLPDPAPTRCSPTSTPNLRTWFNKSSDGGASIWGQTMGEPVTLAAALNQALHDAMDDDPKVLVMGEDVGRLGGSSG